MASLPAAAATNNVVLFDQSRVSPTLHTYLPSGTTRTNEIINLSSSLTALMSPIVPEVQDEQKSTLSTRKRVPKKPSDEQRAIEEMPAIVRDATAKELKRRFPKSWDEHQTLKTKTQRKTNRLQLHPGFATFVDFLIAMGPAPSPSHTVDRIDPNNPVYGPGLCEWKDPKGQANNRSTNTYITWKSERHTLAQWADITGIAQETIKKRHQRDWPPEKMFADAQVPRYRPDAQSTEVEPVTLRQAKTGSYADVAIPAIGADGWPEGFDAANKYEAGYQHMVAQARKNGITPISRAHFGAWVATSRLNSLNRDITRVGLQAYLFFRDQIDPKDIDEVERRARDCPAVAEYFTLLPIQRSFINTHVADMEARNARARYPNSLTGGYYYRQIIDLSKNKPCPSPAAAWEYFMGEQG